MNRTAEIALAPFGALFNLIVGARGKLYDKAILKQCDLRAPVVSVGNLTVGGTGKTPLVQFVAKVLAENNKKVCVLTRGYKRANPRERVVVSDGKRILCDQRAAGDEPFELANKLLNAAAVVADKNRCAAGVWARANLNATAFVLDDGFQHRRLKRDLDIVCVDATNPFGNRRLLPAGILRESLQSLKRADLIVVTRADLVEKSQIVNLKSEISNHADCPILTAQTQIVGLAEISAMQTNKEQRTTDKGQRTKPAFAFCALGNPANFYESLRRADFDLRATLDFADHHVYTQTDIARIERAARSANAEMLLTTAKDWVKLQNLKFDLPCFAVEIEIAFDDAKVLRDLLCAL